MPVAGMISVVNTFKPKMSIYKKKVLQSVLNDCVSASVVLGWGWGSRVIVRLWQEFKNRFLTLIDLFIYANVI